MVKGRALVTWRAALVVCVVALAAGAMVLKIRADRLVVIGAAARVTEAALAEARGAGAARWAADELARAEQASAEALGARRIEETSLWPLPDADRLGERYDVAARAATEAATTARERRAAAERAAADILAQAAAVVRDSAELADRIHVGLERRAALAHARAALAEAEVYARAGEVDTAAGRARAAIDLAYQVRAHAAGVAARYADPATLARWQQWRNETVAWSRREGRVALIVAKESHTLTVISRGVAVRTYTIEMGPNWVSDKHHAGDNATPEGRYRVVARKANGASIYYKALLLDYPNRDDRAEFVRNRRAGTIPVSAAIGGLIEIHGEGGRGRDWTKGCMAVTNADMDELFRTVPVGTPVTIVGSDYYGAVAELGGYQPAER